MDKPLRDSLQRATQEARRLLEKEFGGQLEGEYDILPDGTIPEEPGSHLEEPDRILRWKFVTAIEHKQAGGKDAAEAVRAFLREMAFTTLNRFVALKMLEARGLVQECISHGEQSSGFREFTMLAPGLSDLPGHGYRLYIESLFDEIGQEVRVLFDRRDVPGMLWPRRQALLDLLEILNRDELAPAWEDEEAIGWVYQYFNSDAENKAAKYDEDGKPKAPQNSQELAVRNQFFTPEYVVRFLVDNTLGRLWLEMRKGDTQLRETCAYLVHQPNEVFLAEGEPAPEPSGDGEEANYVPFRAKKDPRDLRVLDPACGSGHFLLYAFGLFPAIYEEAWADPDSPASETTGGTLRADYPDLSSLYEALPGLILAHNLYGVDIDARTAQIAGLALWMRAQTAWRDLEIKRAERPPITRTNIVVAEPMPGETDLRAEFLARLQPSALRLLVEEVFEQMELAGEAGMLLQIENAVRAAIRATQERWESWPRQLELVGGQSSRQDELFDVSNLPERDFWEHAEGRIYQVLQEYVRQGEAQSNLRRRLFADDAAAGIAFIDLCRLRYDVVVMNPPFGTPTPALDTYIQEHYPNSKQDLFAPFVERAVTSLAHGGLVGILSTEAGFFRRTAEDWRRNVVLARSSLSTVAHLGGHVLDGATVRTAAYILRASKPIGQALFLRLFGVPDRAGSLLNVVKTLREAKQSELVFSVPQSEFEKLPFAAFGYWCSQELRNAFIHLPQLEENIASVRVGLQTSYDFRFLRLRWELPAKVQRNWLPFAKGGEYSPFHDDVHLYLYYCGDNCEVAVFPKSVIRNAQDYKKPGLTYTPRTNKRFAPKVLPAAGAFANKGPALVDIEGKPLALLALLNSRPASYLLSLSLGASEAESGAGANSYEVGLVQRLPVPARAVYDTELAEHGRAAWKYRAEADLRDETTALFVTPDAPCGLKDGLRQKARQLLRRKRELTDTYVALQHQIDVRVREHYRLSASDWQAIEEEIPEVHVPEIPDDDDPKADQEFAARFFQYLVGSAFGRWDVRYATGELETPPLPDPFAPLPVCSPGMLQGADGLPLKAPPDGYPTAFPQDGLLVDDPGHGRDLLRRVRDVLRLLFDDPAVIEAELVEMLGENDLATYIRKGSGFFETHRKQYSKSRRKAPIYWQLAPKSANYSVWLYYPRLSRDTFYRVLDVVEGKVEHEERRLTDLKQEAGPEPTASQRKAISDQEDSVTELRAFQKEIERVAPLWNPNLNDGVILNFAPLWRLVSHNRSWQTECKKHWDDLVKGENDWSHLAMHLWPGRVVPQCAERRDLAIAHGLEDIFWYEDADGKWQQREEPKRTIEELVRARTSPTVKAALADLLNAPPPPGSTRWRRR